MEGSPPGRGPEGSSMGLPGRGLWSWRLRTGTMKACIPLRAPEHISWAWTRACVADRPTEGREEAPCDPWCMRPWCTELTGYLHQEHAVSPSVTGGEDQRGHGEQQASGRMGVGLICLRGRGSGGSQGAWRARGVFQGSPTGKGVQGRGNSVLGRLRTGSAWWSWAVEEVASRTHRDACSRYPSTHVASTHPSK